MIYIFTALYCEAQILIRQFDLTRNTENIWFQEFYNETADIRLTISGVGEIAAAAAVGSVCSVYRPEKEDVLLNVGTCAAAESEGIFLCNKITEQATGRTFYPDMLYCHNFREKAIVTGMLPWNGKKTCTELPAAVSAGKFYGGEDAGSSPGTAAGKFCSGESAEALSEFVIGKLGSGESAGSLSGVSTGTLYSGASAEPSSVYPSHSLYDMEAAAVYQAGSLFFGPHQMMFLKVVSDAGSAIEVSREKIERQMEKYQDFIVGFIEQISVITRMTQQGGGGVNLLRQEDEALIQTFCADLHCSRAMRDSMRQYIRYLSLTETDYLFVIRDMYEKGLLPCRDKREGKLRFEEFKRRVF